MALSLRQNDVSEKLSARKKNNRQLTYNMRFSAPNVEVYAALSK